MQGRYSYISVLHINLFQNDCFYGVCTLVYEPPKFSSFLRPTKCFKTTNFDRFHREYIIFRGAMRGRVGNVLD